VITEKILNMQREELILFQNNLCDSVVFNIYSRWNCFAIYAIYGSIKPTFSDILFLKFYLIAVICSPLADKSRALSLYFSTWTKNRAKELKICSAINSHFYTFSCMSRSTNKAVNHANKKLSLSWYINTITNCLSVVTSYWFQMQVNTYWKEH